MTRKERNDLIDRQTHYTLPMMLKNVIDDLLDQGYEVWQISLYLEDTYGKAQDYLTKQL